MGVESCQGRRLSAFILTLDSSPRHFIIERGTKRNAVQLSFVPYLMGLGLVFLLEGIPLSGRPFLAASPFLEKNFAPEWPRNDDHEVGRPRDPHPVVSHT